MESEVSNVSVLSDFQASRFATGHSPGPRREVAACLGRDVVPVPPRRAGAGRRGRVLALTAVAVTVGGWPSACPSPATRLPSALCSLPTDHRQLRVHPGPELRAAGDVQDAG